MPRTPLQTTIRQHLQYLQQIFGCLTEARIIGPDRRALQLGTIYSVLLNGNDPVRLDGHQPLAFSGGQEFRIVQRPDGGNQLLEVEVTQYWYQFALPNGGKLLTFHWTPERSSPGQRTYPHLHVESSVLDPAGPFLPDTFNKLHIPTGPVSLAAIVRFAIEELGVTPIPRDWNERLLKAEAAFWQVRPSIASD